MTVNRFPYLRLLWTAICIGMVVISVLSEWLFAAAVWGVAVGLTAGFLVEDLEYWNWKRKSRLYR